MDMQDKVWLWQYTWEDVSDYLSEKSTILIPIGSVEQHGKHLPLGVDALVAQRLAEDAAKKTGTLVAAPLWYGWAPQHMGFTGTVTLGSETLTKLGEDVILSFIYHGFKRIVFVNGHRIANLPPLQVATTRMRHQTGAYVGIVDPVFLGQNIHASLLNDAESLGLSHAEGLETAHMRYLFPDLVREHHVKRAESGSQPKLPWHVVDPFRPDDRVWTATTSEELKNSAPTGAMGNPPWGTPEIGKRLHESLVDRFADFLSELENYPVTIREDIQYPV
ncbi:creatininase family protein [Siminovitchia sp. 179-K 8D1 HS]|uniref:creatininase family protein n=1 Tax=Siminovitchia sp. 179-K 8D1 HS TaxID=3142385 RepID=UPI0039A24757